MVKGCYYADPATLAQLNANRQIVCRYSDPQGRTTAATNPNGSVENIAGICNAHGNVLGMMPHPERASDPQLGYTDGLTLFKGLLTAAPVAV